MKRNDIPVIVLAASKAWQAAIEREFPASMLIWALDDNDLLTEASQYPDSAIIVEFTATSDATSANWLKLALDHRRRLFVVSGIQHAEQAEHLRALGVADVVVAISEIGRLHTMLRRHNASAPAHNLSLEEQIESALPWRP